MLERFSFDDVGRQFICPFLVIGWGGDLPPSPSHTIHGSDLSLGRIEHVVSHWLDTHEVKNNVSGKMKKKNKQKNRSVSERLASENKKQDSKLVSSAIHIHPY